MPAETHQHQEQVSVESVLEVLAAVLDVEPEAAGGTSLAALGVDDELGLLALWEAVAAELAERTLGSLAVEELDVRTLGELADAFHEALEA
jgi:hypothetical protein